MDGLSVGGGKVVEDGKSRRLRWRRRIRATLIWHGALCFSLFRGTFHTCAEPSSPTLSVGSTRVAVQLPSVKTRKTRLNQFRQQKCQRVSNIPDDLKHSMSVTVGVSVNDVIYSLETGNSLAPPWNIWAP